jgi:hypothetical protein
MPGISLRYFGVGGGSSTGEVSLSEFLGSKNSSPTGTEVARHGNSASKVQRNSMLEEKAADACNKLQSGITLYFDYSTLAY